MKHWLIMIAVIAALGCGDDDSGGDAGTDTGTGMDTGGADTSGTDTGSGALTACEGEQLYLRVTANDGDRDYVISANEADTAGFSVSGTDIFTLNIIYADPLDEFRTAAMSLSHEMGDPPSAGETSSLNGSGTLGLGDEDGATTISMNCRFEPIGSAGSATIDEVAYTEPDALGASNTSIIRGSMTLTGECAVSREAMPAELEEITMNIEFCLDGQKL